MFEIALSIVSEYRRYYVSGDSGVSVQELEAITEALGYEVADIREVPETTRIHPDDYFASLGEWEDFLASQSHR